MKKIFAILVTALFLLGAACAEEIELPVFLWEHDGQNHWQLDEAGNVINLGAHVIGDYDLTCAVCGSEVIEWGDGFTDVTDYDEYGNTLRHGYYDDQGEVVNLSIHVLTCNEDGVVLEDIEYIDGVLYCHATYTVNADGEQIPVLINYWDGDCHSVYEYDEYGNNIHISNYDEDGALFHEIISEFALSDDGWFYECKTTTRFATGEVYYDETNQYGDPVCSRSTDADGNVWGDWHYEYEYANGLPLWSKQYSGDVLTYETIFDNEGYIVQEIEYLEDGSRIVYEYNDQQEYETITTYDADGAVVEVITYEYVYSDEMNVLEQRMYVDGVLVSEEFYEYDMEDDEMNMEDVQDWLDLLFDQFVSEDTEIEEF
nr:hypothetical protein [Clostridia bacterium]